MVERPIKVDEQTDRLVTDLAYFLRSSKKSVVRDAVADFAETHHPRHLGGSGGVDEGWSTAENGSRGAGESAEQVRPAGVGESAEQVRPAGVGTLEDSGTAKAREFGSATNGGGLGSSRLGGAGARGMTFEVLDPLERLAVRRRELLRRFAEVGGTNVRVLDEVDEPGASGEVSTRIVLLAETDPVDGSAAVPTLEEVARRVLGVHVTVVSLTALRMFGSGRLEQALAQSRPL